MDPESILVVEDNALNLKLVRAVLENAGFQVRAALMGEDAVAQAVAAAPALILMDLQLPGMDGYAGLLALRSEPSTRGIPVLAVSALAMRPDREKVQSAGFDGYIEKPISVRDLPEQVRDVLRHPRRLP